MPSRKKQHSFRCCCRQWKTKTLDSFLHQFSNHKNKDHTMNHHASDNNNHDGDDDYNHLLLEEDDRVNALRQELIPAVLSMIRQWMNTTTKKRNNNTSIIKNVDAKITITNNNNSNIQPSGIFMPLRLIECMSCEGPGYHQLSPSLNHHQNNSNKNQQYVVLPPNIITTMDPFVPLV